MSRDETKPRKKVTGSRWTTALWLVPIGAIGIATGIGWSRVPSKAPTETDPKTFIPRTRSLIEQKANSLVAYNRAMPQEELFRFYEDNYHHPMNAASFDALTEIMVGRVIPMLWTEAQKLAPDQRIVTNHAMGSVVEAKFPQTLLSNGDVILLPDGLRLVISEPIQDFFRDSAWHWKWLNAYTQKALDAHTELRELDPYAGEAVSEFLSVLAVAIVKQASDKSPNEASPITPEAIRAAYEAIAGSGQTKPPPSPASGTQPGFHSDANAAPRAKTKPFFSAETKEKIMGSLPSPMFREVASKLGIGFVHAPDPTLRQMRARLEVPVGIEGGGVAASDYDGDGFDDLYFPSGGGGRLYRNVGGKKFEDVTEQVGLKLQGESRAAYFIDYDNDGDSDLFITFVASPNRLFENQNGRFKDVSDEVGLGGGTDVTHGAVWFDMNNDGLLDLYTAGFGQWLAGASPTIGRDSKNGLPNKLYRHVLRNKKHFFEDVTQAAGLEENGWTHCVGAWDFDFDGHVDLFSLNDFGTSFVYRNLGNGRYQEVSGPLHLDASYNAMNFALMDIDRDGRFEIYVSEIKASMHKQRYAKPSEDTKRIFGAKNLANMRILVANKLYTDPGTGIFRDVHADVIEPAELGWSWGAEAFDYENDGDPDLYVLNGTEESPPILPDEKRPSYVSGRTFVTQFAKERKVFYLSDGGYFYDVSDKAEVAYEGSARGMAYFDFDHDGDLDIAINDYDAPARFYRNEQNAKNQWIGFTLRGTRSNRDAIGARIKIRYGAEAQYGVVVAGSGFLSQSPKTLRFGLGSAKKVDAVEVIWPSGQQQEVEGFDAGKIHTIEER